MGTGDDYEECGHQGCSTTAKYEGVLTSTGERIALCMNHWEQYKKMGLLVITVLITMPDYEKYRKRLEDKIGEEMAADDKGVYPIDYRPTESAKTIDSVIVTMYIVMFNVVPSRKRGRYYYISLYDIRS